MINNFNDLLVSSHKIMSDFFNISNDLNVISSRFPIGVETMYRPGKKEFIL